MAFLQYKTEAIPGKPLKRKVAQEETRERKKQYEKDRERKFIDSWKQDRGDPDFITTLNKMLCLMICNWCIEANGPKELYRYIFFCNSKFWFLIILFLVAQSYYFFILFFFTYTGNESFVQIEQWKYTLMNMIMLYTIIYLWTQCQIVVPLYTLY